MKCESGIHYYKGDDPCSCGMTAQEKPLSELVSWLDHLSTEDRTAESSEYFEAMLAQVWPRISAALKTQFIFIGKDVIEPQGPHISGDAAIQFIAGHNGYMRELEELRALFEDLAKRTIPGEVDSGDALIQMLKERDRFKLEVELLSERLGKMVCHCYPNQYCSTDKCPPCDALDQAKKIRTGET